MPDIALEDQMIVSEAIDTVSVGPWKMAWRRFRRHKPGMFGLFVLVIFYLVAIFADFVAPYDYQDEARDLLYTPPTHLHFSDQNGFSWRPFIHPFQMVDEDFELKRKTDTTQRCYIRFFVQGSAYRLLGIIPTKIHFFGVDPAKGGGEQTY